MSLGHRMIPLAMGLVCSISLSTLPPSAALAQSNAGLASLQVPVGARAEAMGRAYGVLESSAFSPFWNVAGMAFVEGLEVAYHTARLVPDLADDVDHYYGSVVFGTNVAKGSTPVRLALGVNMTRLNYGESILTDPGSPDPVGTYEPTEQTWGFAFAAGFADIVSLGAQVKSTNVDLGPIRFSGGSDANAEGSTTVWDYGIQLKTPDLPLGNDRDSAVGMLRFKGGIGWSNNGDDIVLIEGEPGDPTPYVRRESLGADLHLFPGKQIIDPAQGGFAAGLAKAHVINLRMALGREVSLVDDSGGPGDRAPNQNLRGFEASILDLLFLRWGNINDPNGQIKGATYGFGVNVLDYVGYDYAIIPQFRELDHVKKHSVWVRIPLDPFPAK